MLPCNFNVEGRRYFASTYWSACGGGGGVGIVRRVGGMHVLAVTHTQKICTQRTVLVRVCTPTQQIVPDSQTLSKIDNELGGLVRYLRLDEDLPPKVCGIADAPLVLQLCAQKGVAWLRASEQLHDHHFYLSMF